VKTPLWIILAACLLTLVTRATPARASNFEVTPVRLPLSAQASSGLLSVHNQSAEPLRFQVTAFAWSQATNGEMILTPPQELVVVPPQLTLNPGETRNLRIGTLVGFSATEKTYRVFVEELPPMNPPNSTPNAIRVLTKMGIPVFLQGQAPTPAPRIDGLSVQQGRLVFSLNNTGNAHFFTKKVRVVASAADGQTLYEKELPAWYILAGGARAYALALPREACAAARLVAIIETEQTSLQAAVSPPAGACAP